MNKTSQWEKRLYLVIAITGFSFLLKGQAANDSCHQAIEIYCGDSFSVDFGGHQQDTYDSFDGCGYTNDESVWYRFSGTGDFIHVSLCNYGTRIKILENQCDSLTCVDRVVRYPSRVCGSSSEEVGFLSESGKEYFIFCTTLNPTLQSQLTIECGPSPSNDLCSNAIYITTDSIVNFNHFNASIQDIEVCSYQNTYYPDLWYKVEGIGETIKIQYANGSYASSNLFKGDCLVNECVDRSYIYNSITYFLELGEIYYLQILDINSYNQSFSLSTFEYPINDDCSDALPIIIESDTTEYSLFQSNRDSSWCESYGTNYDVWYNFTGDGNIHGFRTAQSNVSINLLEGNCEDAMCIEPTKKHTEVYFKTELNSEYLLSINTHSFVDSTDLLFIREIDSVSNSDFNNAIQITCQDSVTSTFKGAINDRAINNSSNPSVWFEMVGEGKFTQFSYGALQNGSYEQSNVSIFTTSNDTIGSYVYSIGSYYFLEQDIDYLINIDHQDIDSFYLRTECVDVTNNDDCPNALEISLNDTLVAMNSFSTNGEHDGCAQINNSFNDVWYTFMGDSSLREVSVQSDFQRVSIFKGDCDNLVCFDQFTGASYRPTTFSRRLFFESGERYFLKIFNRYTRSTDPPISMNFVELEVAQNDICESAQTLDCGDVVVDSLSRAIRNDFDCSNVMLNDPGIWYHAEGVEGYQEIIIDESNWYSASFPEIFVNSCDSLVCYNDSIKIFRNKIVYKSRLGQDYYFLFKSPESIKFEFRCLSDLANNDIENAYDLSCGNNYFGYSFDASPDTSSYCQEDDPEESDIWFKITGEDKYLYYNTDSYSGRANLIRIYTYDNGTYNCGAHFDGDRIFLNQGITYFLRLKGFDNIAPTHFFYDFNFSVSCHAKTSNDECTEAIVLNCGDSIEVNNTHASDGIFDTSCRDGVRPDQDIWFKIIGDGAWKHVKVTRGGASFFGVFVKTYEGTCSGLICTPWGSKFYAEVGKEYYVNVEGSYNIGNMEISMSCHNTAINDECQNAIEIYDRDTITGTVDYAMIADYYYTFNPDNREKKVWYRIKGNGSIADIKLEGHAYNLHTLRLNVYDDGCCERSEITRLYGNDKHIRFSAEVDKYYLVAISLGATDDDGTYTLSVSLKDSTSYSLCDNAVIVNPNQELSIPTDKSLTYYGRAIYLPDDPVSWIQFVGSGNIDTLAISAENASYLEAAFFLNISNDCLQNRRVYQSYESNGKHAIKTITGMTYSVAISEYHDYRLSVDSINIELIPGQEVVSMCEFDKIPNFHGQLGDPSNVELSVEGTDELVYTEIEISVGSSVSVGFTNEESVLLNFQEEGPKLVKYYLAPTATHSGCLDYDIFYFYNTEEPQLICPESSIICLDTIVQTDPITHSNKFYSSKQIISSSALSKNSKLIYKAGEQIVLKSGFEIDNGTIMTATIEACLED